MSRLWEIHHPANDSAIELFQHAGGSITFGPKVTGSVNFANSNIKSDYASVDQQAGLRAGDNGSQVNVQGDTTLTGGAITSTDKAIAEGKNSFTTGGQLTTSDINNQANYQADSVGVNIGVGVSPLGKYVPGGTSAGIGSDSGKSSSVTRAGISDIAGDKTARTDTNHANTSVALAKIFDADKVQKDINAQVAITQAFGQLAPKAAADYAQARQQELISQANHATNTAEREALLKQADNWGEGGAYRVALHSAVGGMAGGLQGAIGAGATAAAAPLLDQLQNKVIETLVKAGAGEDVAKGASQLIANITAAGLGAAASGTTGTTSVGAAAGLNADANNRQLHPTEIQWIKSNAKRYAQQQGISEQEAERKLAQQAYRQVQFGASGNDDANARNFLKQADNVLLPGDSNIPGQNVGFMFNAPPEQKINPLMYVDSLTNQIDFYVKNNIQIPSIQSIAIAAAKDSQQRDMVAQLTKASGVVSGLVVLAATAPALVTWALTNPDKAVQTGLITVETAAAIATGAITPTSVTEGMASALGRQLTAGEQAALQQFTAVLKAVNQQKVLARQEQSLGELAQMFKPGSNSSVTLAGQRVALEKTNASGTTKLLNTSAIPDAQLEKQVFDYASELSGGLSFTPHPTSAGVWYSKLTDGTTINVRSVSSSNVSRWTIDVQGNPKLGYLKPNNKDNQYEIKFK